MPHTEIDVLRKRMETMLTEAKASGHGIKNIIPKEMQDDFYHLRELKAAKEYIKEGEERAKKLQEEKSELAKQLSAAKKAVEELPEDHKQLKIDVGQRELEVTYYKGLMNAAEARANNFQQKWLCSVKEQAQSDEKDNRIETLELECTEHKALIYKLTNENQKATDVFEMLRDQHMNALEQKEKRLMELEKSIKETRDYSKHIEEENEGFEAAYNDLVRRLEAENGDCATALNKAAECIRNMEKEQCAAVSETVILRRFFNRCFSILSIHQGIFQQLLNNDQQKVIWLPDTLEGELNSSYKECEAFRYVHEAFENEGIQQDMVRDELLGLAISATRMQQLLGAISGDVSHFLIALRQKPDLWLAMRTKFGMFVRK
ncbi:hypothetical protein K505DRAFT_246551 [Melanomma pulvis-pyrius CBS 109.77]|uniref:Uncharacterized protein n=1 Tax=Melanomma pulvis-pyrius CBS 109.77 TaxID=1314802 RepID=A0A6A6X8R2_9PLEO|nr:hypothetical protein K505DRAFT_246551 [Melanomma pulvis-pyrius CBS 109.77]